MKTPALRPDLRLVTVITASMFVMLSCAEMKQTGPQVRYDTHDLTRTIGCSTRDITREIGYGTRDLVNDIDTNVSQPYRPGGR